MGANTPWPPGSDGRLQPLRVAVVVVGQLFRFSWESLYQGVVKSNVEAGHVVVCVRPCAKGACVLSLVVILSLQCLLHAFQSADPLLLL